MDRQSNVVRDERMMKRRHVVDVQLEHERAVTELAETDRMQDLASFLGTDAEAVAGALIEAVEHDASLRDAPGLHRAA